jgi:transcriptional regulator with XRE-family HTH domain
MKLRQAVGEALRRRRQAQGRTLREVADAAGVSLTYLSEVERGRKEASSEVLEAVCAALDLGLAELFFEVAETLALAEAVAGVSGGMRGAEPPAVVGFLPPTAPRAAAPTSIPAPVPAPVAPVLDLRAFASRRTA